jgi:hypothetical protein
MRASTSNGIESVTGSGFAKRELVDIETDGAREGPPVVDVGPLDDKFGTGLKLCDHRNFQYRSEINFSRIGHDSLGVRARKTDWNAIDAWPQITLSDRFVASAPSLRHNRGRKARFTFNRLQFNGGFDEHAEGKIARSGFKTMSGRDHRYLTEGFLATDRC